jgi:hypothetical protein
MANIDQMVVIASHKASNRMRHAAEHAGQVGRYKLCPALDANESERTIYISEMRRSVRDALSTAGDAKVATCE